MRTFIALELPVDFADDIAGMVRTLSASMDGRFLGRDTYHVTLAFLGDIAEADVSHAMDAMDEAVKAVGPEADAAGPLPMPDALAEPAADNPSSGSDAASESGYAAGAIPLVPDGASESNHAASVIPLVPDGLGKFGRAADATLWLGLEKAEPLMALAEGLREGLRSRGLTFDDKPFLPHITLARRVRLPKGPLPQLAFPLPAGAPAITLFKSTLNRDGATYKPLYSRELPR